MPCRPFLSCCCRFARHTQLLRVSIGIVNGHSRRSKSVDCGSTCPFFCRTFLFTVLLLQDPKTRYLAPGSRTTVRATCRFFLALECVCQLLRLSSVPNLSSETCEAEANANAERKPRMLNLYATSFSNVVISFGRYNASQPFLVTLVKVVLPLQRT